MRIGNRTKAFEWYRFNDLSRPLTSFQGHAIFDAEYLRNDTIHRHNMLQYYRYLDAPYLTVLYRMILSDLEWLSKIFNDTKHREVSIRQLSLFCLSSYVIKACRLHNCTCCKSLTTSSFCLGAWSGLSADLKHKIDAFLKKSRQASKQATLCAKIMKKYKYTLESWILYIWQVASEAFAYLSWPPILLNTVMTI